MKSLKFMSLQNCGQTLQLWQSGIAMLCPTSGTMNLFNQDFGEGWSNLRPFL